ncbi:MAG: hypothetical protein ACI9N9_000121 [Enterobacterales bacterium]|jgi:hypothetical protein
MLKKWSLRLFLGLIALIIIGLFTAPAQLLESQLTSQIPGLKTTTVTGRLVSGEFKQLQYKKTTLNQVTWDLSLLSLLSANIGADISIDDPLFKGQLFIQQGVSGSTSISAVNATQSLVEVAKNYSPLRLLSPKGVLEWQAIALSFDNQAFEQADGEILWKNAQIAFNGNPFTLGTIKLSPSIENGELLLQLSSDSQLDLEGIIKVNRNRTYQLSTSIKEELPTNIFNAVRYFARPNGNGRLEMTMSGRW